MLTSTEGRTLGTQNLQGLVSGSGAWYKEDINGGVVSNSKNSEKLKSEIWRQYLENVWWSLYPSLNLPEWMWYQRSDDRNHFSTQPVPWLSSWCSETPLPVRRDWEVGDEWSVREPRTRSQKCSTHFCFGLSVTGFYSGMNRQKRTARPMNPGLT